QHFPDLEALYIAVASAYLDRILAGLQPVQTHGTLEERAAALVSERGRLSERTLPMRKLAARFEASSEAATVSARFGRDVHRRGCEIAFQPELADVSEAERRELLAALQTAMDGNAWAYLRHSAGLDAREAEQVCCRLVLGLMRDAVRAGRPRSPGGRPGPAG